MPANDFTVGRDLTLVVKIDGVDLDLSGLTDFSAKPITSEIKSKAIDGGTRHAYIPDGWDLSFKVDRLNPSLDNWQAAKEEGYFSGKNQKAGTIYETIQEADGSLTQWRYTGVVLKLDSAGDFGGDKKVDQSLSGKASRKIKVS